MNFGIGTLVIHGLFIFILGNFARAESFYAPGLCDPAQSSLIAKNISSKPQAFWVQLKNPDREIRYELNPYTVIRAPAADFLTSAQAFSIRTWTDRNLVFQWQCEGLSFNLTSSISPLVEYPLDSSGVPKELLLMNLSPFENWLEITFLNSAGEEISKEKISLQKYYETQLRPLNIPHGAALLRIQGDARLHSWLIEGKQKINSHGQAFISHLEASSQKKYFLVSTREKNSEESFVVGIKDPQMIEVAMQQIENPLLEKIMVARITAGHGDYNRSFHEKNHSPYSWSVTEVDNFADFALNDCDGTPDLIEQQLQQRLAEGGRICFWRYRIIRELTLQEVQRGY